MLGIALLFAVILIVLFFACYWVLVEMMKLLRWL